MNFDLFKNNVTYKLFTNIYIYIYIYIVTVLVVTNSFCGFVANHL